MKIEGILEEKELILYAQMLVRRKFSPKKLLALSCMATVLLGTIGLLPLLWGQAHFYVIAWPVWLIIGIPLFYFWIPRLLFKTTLDRLHKLGSQLHFEMEWLEESIAYTQSRTKQKLTFADLDQVWQKDGLWSIRFTWIQVALPSRLLSSEQIDFLEERREYVTWLPGL